MKIPIHRYKNFVRYTDNSKPPYWSYDGRPCWLGSGVKDVKGQEIYEGDKVIFGEHNRCGVVSFQNGLFQIDYRSEDNKELHCILGQSRDFINVEVVGHIAED